MFCAKMRNPAIDERGDTMDKKMMHDCMKMMHSAHKATGGHSSAAASGGLLVGRGIIQPILSRPLAVFSLGVTLGALAYKKRKEIMNALEPATKEVVRTVTKTGDASKDFIQGQKEKLSDIIAEVKEEEEAEAKKKAESEG